MTRWEYKFVQIDINLSPILSLARWAVQVPGEKKARETMDNVEKYFTELGGQGWEIVSVAVGNEHTGIITRAVVFMRRPLEPAPAAA